MDQYVNETVQCPRKEREATGRGYDSFKTEIDRIFVESMELTEKVNWFTQIYSQLKHYQVEKRTLKDFVLLNTHD